MHAIRFFACAPVLALLCSAPVTAQETPPAAFSVALLDRPVGFQTVPFDLNETGEAVGYYLDSALHYRAIYWDAGGAYADLAGAGSWSQAHGIADNGRICGYYGPTLRAAEPTVWTPTGMETLARPQSSLNDCASSGRTVGATLVNASTWQIAFWQGTGTVPPTGAMGGNVASVNEAGEAVGTVIVDGFPRAAHWTANGDLTLLPGISGDPRSGASGISESGSIVGTEMLQGTTVHVVWSSPAAAPRALERFQGRAGVVRDVNDAGWVVGADQSSAYNNPTRALIWDQHGTPVDLNTLIDTNAGWTLRQAVAINEAGQILGHGSSAHASGQVAFRLTPSE